MTIPIDTSEQASAKPPLALRIAAGLCAVVGMLSVFAAIALGAARHTANSVAWIVFGSNLTAALLMCAAAAQTWRARKIGTLFVVLAWAVPTVMSLLLGQSPRGPSLLMVLALIVLASNWRELH
jgi:hypothetical protein